MTNFYPEYFNVKKDEKKRRLYRIISLDRLFEMFREAQNILVQPHLWDDPFENFIMGLKGELPDGELIEFGQRHAFYGQCWSMQEGTDAMWRIYSHDKKSVCIQVLLDDLAIELARFGKGLVFLGKMSYLTPDELFRWAKRVLRNSGSPTINLLAKSLLVKRTAFSHEKEVRLLYFDPRYTDFLNSDQKHPYSIFKYSINPHQLIRRIILDPRMEIKDFRNTVELIKCKTGFKGPILQSQLYVPPPNFVLKLNDKYATMERTKRKLIFEGDRKILKAPSSNSFQQLLLPIKK